MVGDPLEHVVLVDDVAFGRRVERPDDATVGLLHQLQLLKPVEDGLLEISLHRTAASGVVVVVVVRVPEAARSFQLPPGTGPALRRRARAAGARPDAEKRGAQPRVRPRSLGRMGADDRAPEGRVSLRRNGLFPRRILAADGPTRNRRVLSASFILLRTHQRLKALAGRTFGRGDVVGVVFVPGGVEGGAGEVDVEFVEEAAPSADPRPIFFIHYARNRRPKQKN